MGTGWIRAYADEDHTLKQAKKFILRSDRTAFRSKFRTRMRKTKKDTAELVKTLPWGAQVELPDGLSGDDWTKVRSGSKEGFVQSAHVVEVAYVKRRFEATLDTSRGKRILLWGDLVQITKSGPKRCEVRARGSMGKMNTADLGSEPLLEVYFVDVGQGDGVLVRTPDGRHMLIDGGLERTKQLTGKNAADFIDWKFFFDYGDFRIRLDSLMASHSDNDHYGGLHDLVREGAMAERELDCEGVDIKTLHHPGLSRWTHKKDAIPQHRDGLGPRKDPEQLFVRLLGNRTDAEKSVKKGAAERLSGPWQRFIAAVLRNSGGTKVERIVVDRDHLQGGGTLPKLWQSKADCDVFVLGPVSVKSGGKAALPDLGVKSINTNGHSICLRVDYKNARILLTGDLNKKSMEWLTGAYGDRMGAWECDVAKACHHGSHDISYKFLEKIRAAATVISSGDAEGHAHPRPEIVGASATTGFPQIDRESDRLLTPLIYMTEIERSVSLGALNRIDFRQVPVGDDKVDGGVLGRNVDELNDQAYMTPEDRVAFRKIKDKKKRDKFLRQVVKTQEPLFAAMENDVRTGKVDVDFNLTVPQGPVSSRNVRKRAWRSRIMEKNHYGLVNVRTDGKTIMCATLNETEKKWVIHTFAARFPRA